MGDVINLNRFRKKKARDEKERRAETNRRLHGRTKSERAQEEAEKERLDKKIDGAFLVREMISHEDIPQEDAAQNFDKLEAATEHVLSMSEFSHRLREKGTESSDADQGEDEQKD